LSKFEFEVRPHDLRVDIGMPVHHPHLPFPTVVSLVDTAKVLTTAGIESRQVSPVGCSIVTDARSAIVDEFLKGNSTHLFWVDGDMHWHPRDFVRILTLCTQVDVVGATYPQKVEPIRFMVRKMDDRMSELGLIKVAGLGLGFVCMKREVVEKVAAGKPNIITNSGTTPMREVFRLDRVGEHRLGEDMAFFEDIKTAGYQVWLDPMVNVAHVGMKMYVGDVMEAITPPPTNLRVEPAAKYYAPTFDPRQYKWEKR
jgi:hypothetical protein